MTLIEYSDVLFLYAPFAVVSTFHPSLESVVLLSEMSPYLSKFS